MPGEEVVATPCCSRQGRAAQDVKIAAGGCVSPKNRLCVKNAPALDPGHEGQTMLRFILTKSVMYVGLLAAVSEHAKQCVASP